jgi:NAD(P)-dependent dehydrogenase (short-subunit alcohol dehydrogenase family)
VAPAPAWAPWSESPCVGAVEREKGEIVAAEVIGAGRVAVVTGAAGGIGRALADAFVAAGSQVVLADVDADAVQAAGAELAARGGEVLPVAVDVADAGSVQALADVTVERFGRVDVLCNNAGVSTFNLLREQTLDDWRWLLDVNLWGVVHGLAAFLPVLRGQEHPAHVVNTASMGGVMGPVPFIAPYQASKAAVIAISEGLHVECQAFDPQIGVSVLCPSSTQSGVMESERNRPSDRGVEQRTEEAEAMRLGIRSTLDPAAGGFTAAAVAARTLTAIREDLLWIFVHDGERPMVEARVDAMLAAFPPP